MKISFMFLLSLSLLLLSFPSPTLCATKEKCNPEDKKVLLQIKAALSNPYLLKSWDPNTDCCDWCCLRCDIYPPYRVKELRISGNGNFFGEISGEIPNAVGDLPYLQNLEFHRLTNLTGQIPPAIAKLKNLNYLTLSWNNLSGPVPTFFTQLKKLVYLDLSFNDLTGQIPSELWEFQSLVDFHLDRNKLTGPIPESFGKFKGKIPNLYLSHNQLTGSIPRSLGDLNFSFAIDFSRNKLEGDASFLFGKKKTVGVVDLSRNLFEFDLSKVEFDDNLQSLDLNHNKIYGKIPDGLAKLTKLVSLNVSYNRLCGKIPIGGELQKFDSTAYFHNRCLCGAPLPTCK